MQNWPHLVWTWQDAQNAPAVFRPGRGVLSGYARALCNYAETIGDILKGNSPLKIDDAADIERQVMSQLWRLPAHAEHKPLEQGEKFTVLVPVKGPNGKTIDVITAWMYDRWSEDIDGKKVQKCLKTIPRLTTIYVDPKSKARYE